LYKLSCIKPNGETRQNAYKNSGGKINAYIINYKNNDKKLNDVDRFFTPYRKTNHDCVKKKHLAKRAKNC